jgi:hypothetical protein
MKACAYILASGVQGDGLEISMGESCWNTADTIAYRWCFHDNIYNIGMLARPSSSFYAQSSQDLHTFNLSLLSFMILFYSTLGIKLGEIFDKLSILISYLGCNTPTISAYTVLFKAFLQPRLAILSYSSSLPPVVLVTRSSHKAHSTRRRVWV